MLELLPGGFGFRLVGSRRGLAFLHSCTGIRDPLIQSVKIGLLFLRGDLEFPDIQQGCLVSLVEGLDGGQQCVAFARQAFQFVRA